VDKMIFKVEIDAYIKRRCIMEENIQKAYSILRASAQIYSRASSNRVKIGLRPPVPLMY
jgi:hypothetical protein